MKAVGIDRWMILLAVLGSLVIVDSAFAYVDPTTGSICIQVLLAGFAGFSVAIKMLLKQVVLRIRGKSQSN